MVGLQSITIVVPVMEQIPKLSLLFIRAHQIVQVFMKLPVPVLQMAQQLVQEELLLKPEHII